MNLGRSDERADATAAFHEALAFEESEGVARSHEADAMRAREVALGRDTIAGLKLAGIDALANEALNALIRRQSVRDAGRESLRSERFLAMRHRLHPSEGTRSIFANMSSSQAGASAEGDLQRAPRSSCR